MARRDIPIYRGDGVEIPMYADGIKNPKEIAYVGENSTGEVFVFSEIAFEGDKGCPELIALPKGTKVLSNSNIFTEEDDSTIQLIQNFYENRRG